jgi:hypothetical protein
MRIIIDGQSFGPPQLTAAMKAIVADLPGTGPLVPKCNIGVRPHGWVAQVGCVTAEGTGPFIALCNAAHAAGYEVVRGR